MCLGDACAELSIPNPALRVQRLPEPASDRYGLTVENLRAFREAYDHEETKALVETLILTGMHWGEASALRWDDMDNERKLIHVRRSHRFNVIGKPKGGRTRIVPLCSVLADVLQEHRQRLLAEQDTGMEAGWCFATVTKRGRNKGTIRLRTPSSVQKVWKKACEKAGVKAKPHDLRRTFVDLLRQAKVDAVVEHAIVGHADEKMRKHYSTVRPPEANEAMDKVVKLVIGD